MDERKTSHRTNFLTKRDYQLRLALRICALILIGAVISSGLLFFFSKNTLTTTFENSNLTIKSTASAILPTVLLTNLVTLTLICIAAIIIILIVTHRITGPMLRFQKEFNYISQGDLTHDIRVRRNDQVEELTADLNAMREKLRLKIRHVKTEIDEIEKLTPGSGRAPEVADRLKALQTFIETNFSI